MFTIYRKSKKETMKVIGLSIDVVGDVLRGGYENKFVMKLNITNHMNDFVIITKISVAEEFIKFFFNKTQELKGELGKKLKLGDGSIHSIQTLFKASNYCFFNKSPSDVMQRQLVVSAGKTTMVAQFAIPLMQLTVDDVAQWMGEFSIECCRQSIVDGKTACGVEFPAFPVCVSFTTQKDIT